MRSLEESVRRLEGLAGKLNKATDKLNEQSRHSKVMGARRLG
jgi:hypothetical protein